MAGEPRLSSPEQPQKILLNQVPFLILAHPVEAGGQDVLVGFFSRSEDELCFLPVYGGK